MSDGSNQRRVRRSRPGVESLEGRSLLSVATASGSLGIQARADSGRVRRFDYTTPQGAKVNITLYGVGSLAGSTLDADGALNLVFGGTNESSKILSHVSRGFAPLRSLENASLSPNSLSGVGGTVIGNINLRNFDLVDGGRINLEAGVALLSLNSIGANTQLHLRELAESITTSTTGAATALQNGQTLGFLSTSSGARVLSSVSGLFTAGTNLVGTKVVSATTGSNPGPPPAPPGLVLEIKHVNGPSRPNGGLGDPEIFGYDKTANALVGFDAATGNPIMTIPNALPSGGTEAGVSLARNGNARVVLVSDGLNVYAYDPATGSKAGQFSVSSAAVQAAGLAHPTRIGSSDSSTVIGDPNGGANGLGALLPIDVTKSLASGVATPTGAAYNSQRALGLSGGLSGVPGLNNLYAVGGARFDPYQPNNFQVGVVSLSNAAGTLAEVGRTTTTSLGTTIDATSHGASTATGNLNDALGSLGQYLTLDAGLATSMTTGQIINQVSLISPVGFSRQGEVDLNYPNLLTDLSGSIRPAIQGAALIDVQGNTQSFRATDTQGLLFNGEGNTNLVKIESASDTTIIGYPFSHAAIPRRSNVTIITPTRTVGERSDVTVVPGLKPTGPLSLP